MVRHGFTTIHSKSLIFWESRLSGFQSETKRKRATLPVSPERNQKEKSHLIRFAGVGAPQNPPPTPLCDPSRSTPRLGGARSANSQSRGAKARTSARQASTSAPRDSRKGPSDTRGPTRNPRPGIGPSGWSWNGRNGEQLRNSS